MEVIPEFSMENSNSKLIIKGLTRHYNDRKDYKDGVRTFGISELAGVLEDAAPPPSSSTASLPPTTGELNRLFRYLSSFLSA